MPRDCSQRGPLSRSGHTQADRRRAELDPGYFRVDERDLADLVIYGRRFAAHLRYYNGTNQAAGDWETFFASDQTAALAALSKLPVDVYRGTLADVERFLAAEESRPAAELRAHFKLIFHLPLTLLGVAGRRHAALPADQPLWLGLRRVAGRDLEAPLSSIVRYYGGALALTPPPASNQPLFQDTALQEADYLTAPAPGDPRPRLSTTVSEDLFTGAALSALALPPELIEPFAPSGWPAFYAGVLAGPGPDTSPYVDAVGQSHQLYEQIYDALNYNLLTTSLERVFQTLERMRLEARDALAASLEEFAGHTPHYGLWLAFLQLFDRARGELNRLTERHLDFYFREVLQLTPREYEPDRVHLLFELAKTKQSALLDAGTELRAGKDELGNDVTYALDEEFVVNRATVSEIRGVELWSDRSKGDLRQVVFASPVANSRDGRGEELPKDDPTWPPFGPRPYAAGAASDAPAAPLARLGFAISDRRLFLREGMRAVWLRAEFAAPLSDPAIAPRFRARLTAEEEWLVLEDPAQITVLVEPGHLDVFVLLDGEAPAIVPYDPELHGDEHATSGEPAPVLELEYAFESSDDEAARAYAVLREATLQSVAMLAVAWQLRDLTLLTPDGVADPAKPFDPFGARPQEGASLIVGSSEIFSKPLVGLALAVKWQEPYSKNGFFYQFEPSSYAAAIDYLDAGAWSSAGSSQLQLDRSSSALLVMPAAADIEGAAEQTVDNARYGARSRFGFARLSLLGDFGHDAYPAEYARAAIGLAGGAGYTATTNVNVSSGLPREPYTPTITEITAGYVTAADPPASFRHLHPFGSEAREAVGSRLLPEVGHEGALYLGLDGAAPPEKVAILLQVSDGTGDPLLEVPELEYAYLEGDRWLPFEPQDVDDKSGGLVGSGVLGLALSEAADTSHGVLPSGSRWVRLAVRHGVAALNRLEGVHAQAAVASFVERGNDPAFLATPLAAKTIAKPVVPNAAIKKIVQPYPSFGGRPREASEAFYRRVSERLRHKDRASTMWDYEHLILEAFPKLYRVKCLSHTELLRNGGKVRADNELSPGHVVVVTVPYTSPGTTWDPLRPYTDQATLEAVDGFLRSRMSAFVELEVANPKFEEIEVKFEVAFHDEIQDIAFYSERLQQAIVDFLTPWAAADASAAGWQVEFGGRVHKSTLIDFVEEQSYVNYVENFEMYHRPDPESPTPKLVDQESIEATTARSILVSRGRHTITEIALP